MPGTRLQILGSSAGTARVGHGMTRAVIVNRKLPRVGSSLLLWEPDRMWGPQQRWEVQAVERHTRGPGCGRHRVSESSPGLQGRLGSRGIPEGRADRLHTACAGGARVGLRTGSVGQEGWAAPAAPELALGSPAEAGPDRGPEAAHREAPLPRAHAGDHPAHAGQ